MNIVVLELHNRGGSLVSFANIIKDLDFLCPLSLELADSPFGFLSEDKVQSSDILHGLAILCI